MYRRFRSAVAGSVFLALGACAGNMVPYTGPPVTGIVVKKADRKLYLLNGNEPLKTFNIELGFQPVGPKHFEGDGKTPEGYYTIDYRNPNTVFHRGLMISYPNAQDIAYAKAHHKPPGEDIFIHGQSPYPSGKKDWTYGCIAVSNANMDQIYAMVRLNTPIWIEP